MTELQMGLIGLGATAVVGVFAYNKWQEHRHRKLAEAVLKPQHDDVLLGDGPKAAVKPAAAERSEPEMRHETLSESVGRVEPMLADVDQDSPDDDFPPAFLEDEPAPVSTAGGAGYRQARAATTRLTGRRNASRNHARRLARRVA
ncbi:MAG: hypothetical protein IPP59_01860 [Betaproteobacteria bacterium]|nr:hypothetical protein [Candidatus Dechloromonas phosphorivorans]